MGRERNSQEEGRQGEGRCLILSSCPSGSTKAWWLEACSDLGWRPAGEGVAGKDSQVTRAERLV